MRILLSHVMDEHQPNWPDSPGLTVRPRDRIANGDVANTNVIEIYSHYGTHVDVPWHFIDSGRRLSDLPIDAWVFDRPVLVDLPLQPEELITGDHLMAHAEQIRGHDMVLIRSGHERHRADFPLYEHHGPGWSVDGARVLRAEFPEVRAVALDWLSLCAVQHVEEGIGAHRVLLDDADGSFVLIFEDVKISALGDLPPSRVYALPLMINGLDGAPCTVVAETE